MLSQESVDQLRRFMELRDVRDQNKRAYEVSEEEYREAEAEIHEALEDNPVSGSLKVNLGEPWGTVAFSPRSTVYGQIIDEEAALEYFNERAMTEEVSAPNFVMRRINEEVRFRKENGQSMPPGISYITRRGVTITRQKA